MFWTSVWFDNSQLLAAGSELLSLGVVRQLVCLSQVGTTRKQHPTGKMWKNQHSWMRPRRAAPCFDGKSRGCVKGNILASLYRLSTSGTSKQNQQVQWRYQPLCWLETGSAWITGHFLSSTILVLRGREFWAILIAAPSHALRKLTLFFRLSSTFDSLCSVNLDVSILICPGCKWERSNGEHVSFFCFRLAIQPYIIIHTVGENDLWNDNLRQLVWFGL